MTRLEQFEERGIRFCAPSGKISSKLPVFYNPAMTHNRDISILVLKALEMKDLRIALPLAATGIRGVRLWKELGSRNIASLEMNDANPDAVALIKGNLGLNRIASAKILVKHDDASHFLLEGKKQHYVDIDPFGFPGPFLDAAVKKVANGGVLAVTATDCGALCGSYPAAGKRKYWSSPLRNMFMHETGLRILVRRVQMVAGQYGKAAKAILSYSKQHYMRIFFSIKVGRQAADAVLRQHGYISFCKQCLRWSTNVLELKCGCGAAMEHAGPVYLGKLWDSSLLKKMRSLNEYEDLDKFLSLLHEESRIDAIGFYDMHEVVKAHSLGCIPKREALISQLKKMGHKASPTHFTGKGIRTTALLEDVLKAIEKS